MLRLALIYAGRELRTGLRGFGVFMACLAIGVAAIGGVNAVAVGVLTGLQQEGRAILGGDVSLRRLIEPFEGAQLTFLAERSVAVTETVEMRGMAGVPNGDRRTLVELKGVDPALYPLYGTVELDGAVDLAEALAVGPEGLPGAAVDPLVLDRLDLSFGDTIRLGESVFRVTAALEREPDRAATGGFVLGPRVMVGRQALAQTGLEQPGSLVYYTAKIAIEPEANPDDLVAVVGETFPEAGWRARVFTDASPQLTATVERLALFLTLVGLTALVVGGVGIGNAVRAFLDGRLGTIATLKCLGAPARLIFLTYLIQIGALAGVGIIIGLILAGITPLIVTQLITDLLPVPLVLGLSVEPLLLAAAFGVLIALAFTLWPLARARRLPAASLFRDLVMPAGVNPGWRAALAVGVCALLLIALAVTTAVDRPFAAMVIAGLVGTFVIFRVAAAGMLIVARKLPRPRATGPRLALGNLTRPGTPAPAVILSLGLGLTILVTLGAIEANLSRQVANELPRNAPAFFFIDLQPDQVRPVAETVSRVAGTGEWEAVPSLRGRIMAGNGIPGQELLTDPDYGWLLNGDRGVTYRPIPRESDQILEGEWWPADYSGPPLVSIYKDIADGLGLGVGDTLTVNVLGRDIDAEITSVRDIDWDSLQLNFTIVFSPGLLSAAPHTFIATLGAEPSAEAGIADAVADAFPNVTMVRVRDALDSVQRVLGQIGLAIRSAAGIAVATGALVLAGAIAAGHQRRVYDSVVLKVLGATRPTILRAYLYEYGALGLLTGLLAAGVGGTASWWLAVYILEIGYVFPTGTVFFVLSLGLAVTLTLGFLGTWRALAQKAAPLLRNE